MPSRTWASAARGETQKPVATARSKTSGVRFIETVGRQRLRRAAAWGRERRTWSIDDGDRNQPRDLAPVLPAIEGAEIVRAHDPDEMDTGASPLQIGDRLIAIGRTDPRFEHAHHDARMPADFYRRFGTLRERRQLTLVLQRICRAHEPPDAIEPQAP